MLTQALQRNAQEHFVAASTTDNATAAVPLRLPQPLRTLRHWRGFPHLLGRVVGVGFLPERLTGSLEPLRHE